MTVHRIQNVGQVSFAVPAAWGPPPDPVDCNMVEVALLPSGFRVSFYDLYHRTDHKGERNDINAIEPKRLCAPFEIASARPLELVEDGVGFEIIDPNARARPIRYPFFHPNGRQAEAEFVPRAALVTISPPPGSFCWLDHPRRSPAEAKLLAQQHRMRMSWFQLERRLTDRADPWFGWAGLIGSDDHIGLSMRAALLECPGALRNVQRRLEAARSA